MNHQCDGDTVLVLDCTMRDGKPVLLNGHGEPLRPGMPPVYLPFKVHGRPLCNSAGEQFSPQPEELT